MKWSQEFAKYYSISMAFGFMLFFVLVYLKKQEIFAVLFVSFFVAIVFINKDKKQ